MKLTDLHIVGFKTFVEPAHITIHEGLTGIVGPNGCGKSNLVEAMRWAMGESSYKSMRASAMEDVIFAGSAKRSSRNNASVKITLKDIDPAKLAQIELEKPLPKTLKDTKKQASKGYDKNHENETQIIEITRVISRGEGSHYIMNGRNVRARDVSLLFADASTGARSPSMVGQGRIGEIITAKPTERRHLLEEAAGISGLHTRRHEAKLRLKNAEQNLERLDDILANYERQLQGLKKQAHQATKFRKISKNIRDVEAFLNKKRLLKAYENYEDAAKTLKDIEQDVLKSEKELTNKNTRQAQLSAQMVSIKEEVQKSQAAMAHIMRSIEQFEAEKKRIIEQRKNLEEQRQQGLQTLEREKNLRKENKVIYEKVKAHLIEINNEQQSLQEAINENAREVELDEAEKQFKYYDEQAQKAIEVQIQFKAEQKAKEKVLSAANHEKTQANERLENARMALKALKTPDHEEKLLLIETYHDIEATLNRQQSQLAHLKLAHEAAQKTKEESAHTLKTCKMEHTLLLKEQEALISMIKRQSVDNKAALAQHLKIQNGYEKAVLAALLNGLDASLEEEEGKYWRLMHVPNIRKASILIQNTFDDVTPILNYVQVPEPLIYALSGIGIVEDIEKALLYQPKLLTGQALVTIEGGVWRWDGYSIQDAADYSQLEGMIARKKYEESTRLILDKERKIELLEEELKATKNEEDEKRQAVLDAEDALKICQNHLNEKEKAIAKIEKEFTLFKVNQEGAALKVEAARNVLSEVEQRHQELQNQTFHDMPQISEEEIQHLKGEAEKKREEFQHLKNKKNEIYQKNLHLDEKKSKAKEEIKLWQRRIEKADQLCTVLEEQDEAFIQALIELEDDPGKDKQEKEKLINARIHAEKNYQNINEQHQAIEHAHKESDFASRQALKDLSEKNEQKGRCEERLKSAKQQKEALLNFIDEQMNETAEFLLQQNFEDFDWKNEHENELSTRLERLKADRTRIGGVNLQAEEEMQTLSKQVEALKAERDDVHQAIDQLLKVIYDLNKEGRSRMLEAFKQVSEHFKILFQSLFSGGKAELNFIDTEDPLEAGLEILAQPPGKKPQTMSLLSGGEQALTAMALIFAVFLTRPAPICVLDEVDAPLDDANVTRFCNLLDKIIERTKTRFLVITHNPITMARMQRLYGVTMAEKGVSQILSVDLETGLSYRE